VRLSSKALYCFVGLSLFALGSHMPDYALELALTGGSFLLSAVVLWVTRADGSPLVAAKDVLRRFQISIARFQPQGRMSLRSTDKRHD